MDEDGNEMELTGEDDMAKCICHEPDHLNGVVFLDKVYEFLELTD